MLCSTQAVGESEGTAVVFQISFSGLISSMDSHRRPIGKEDATISVGMIVLVVPSVQEDWVVKKRVSWVLLGAGLFRRS